MGSLPNLHTIVFGMPCVIAIAEAVALWLLLYIWNVCSFHSIPRNAILGVRSSLVSIQIIMTCFIASVGNKYSVYGLVSTCQIFLLLTVVIIVISSQ